MLLACLRKAFRGPKGGQLGIGLLVGAMDVATANNTVAIVMANPIAKDMAKDYGITVDKRKIQLSDAIRAYGKYDLDVKLYTDIVGKVHVLVCN